MKKSRRAYVVFLMTCLLLTWFFSSRLVFLILLLGLSLPAVLAILLFLDVKRMRFEVCLDGSILRGEKTFYRIIVNRFPLLAAGQLHVQLTVENHLIGQIQEQSAFLRWIRNGRPRSSGFRIAAANIQ